MAEDWKDDPEAKRWVHEVLTDMAPKMAESAYVMQLVPRGEHSEGDVKFWVELGASIMMDKPILAVIEEGQKVPEKLRLIADRIVRLPPGPPGPEGAERLQRALSQMHEDLGISDG
jgi:hypothetical protein